MLQPVPIVLQVNTHQMLVPQVVLHVRIVLLEHGLPLQGQQIVRIVKLEHILLRLVKQVSQHALTVLQELPQMLLVPQPLQPASLVHKDLHLNKYQPHNLYKLLHLEENNNQ